MYLQHQWVMSRSIAPYPAHLPCPFQPTRQQRLRLTPDAPCLLDLTQPPLSASPLPIPQQLTSASLCKFTRNIIANCFITCSCLVLSVYRRHGFAIDVPRRLPSTAHPTPGHFSCLPEEWPTARSLPRPGICLLRPANYSGFRPAGLSQLSLRSSSSYRH